MNLFRKFRKVKSHRPSRHEGSNIKSHRASPSDTGFIPRIIENLQSIAEGNTERRARKNGA